MSISAETISTLPLPPSAFSRTASHFNPSLSRTNPESLCYATGTSIHIASLSPPELDSQEDPESPQVRDITFRLSSHLEEGEFVECVYYFDDGLILVGSTEGTFLMLTLTKDPRNPHASPRPRVPFSQKFSHSPLLRIRPVFRPSVAVDDDETDSEPVDEVVVLVYSGVLVEIRPKGLFRLQREYRSAADPTELAYDHPESEFLSRFVRRWFVRSATSRLRKKVNDVLAFDNSDSLLFRSALSPERSPLHVLDHPPTGPSTSLHSSPQFSSRFLVCGSDPCLALYEPSLTDATDTSESLGSLIRGAGASAGKIARKVTSYVFSWFQKQLGDEGEEVGESDMTEGSEESQSQEEMIPSRPIGTTSSFKDPPREIIQIVPHPSTGKVVLLADSLGRVMVVDETMVLIQMLKGRREAQCGWIRQRQRQRYGNRNRISRRRRMRGRRRNQSLFFVYSTLRGLLELWDLSSQTKVAVIRVGKLGKIVSSRDHSHHVLILPSGEAFRITYGPPVTPFGKLFDSERLTMRNNQHDEDLLESLEADRTEFECKRVMSQYETFFYVGMSLDVVLEAPSDAISPDNHIDLTEFALSMLRASRLNETKFLEVENVELVESYLENRMKLIQVYKLLTSIHSRAPPSEEVVSEFPTQWGELSSEVLEALGDVIKMSELDLMSISPSSLDSGSLLSLRSFLGFFKEVSAKEEFPVGNKWVDVGRFLYDHLDSSSDLVMACLSQLALPHNLAVLQVAIVHWALACETRSLLRVDATALRQVVSFCLSRTGQHEVFCRAVTRLCQTPSNVCSAFLFLHAVTPVLQDHIKPHLLRLIEAVSSKLLDVIILQSLLPSGEAEKLLWPIGQDEDHPMTIYRLFAAEQLASSSDTPSEEFSTGEGEEEVVCDYIFRVLSRFKLQAFSADTLFYHCVQILFSSGRLDQTLRRVKQISDAASRAACCIQLWNTFVRSCLSRILHQLRSTKTILPSTPSLDDPVDIVPQLTFFVSLVECLSTAIEESAEIEGEDEDEFEELDVPSDGSDSTVWFRLGTEGLESLRREFVKARLTKRDVAGFRSLLVFLSVMLDVDPTFEIEIGDLFSRSVLARVSRGLYDPLPRIRDDLSASKLRFRRRGFMQQFLPKHAPSMLSLCEAFDGIPEDYVHIEMMKHHFLDPDGDYQHAKESLMLISNSLQAGSALIEVCKVKMKQLVGMIGKDGQRLHLLSEMDARLFQWVQSDSKKSQGRGSRRAPGRAVVEEEEGSESPGSEVLLSEEELVSQLQDLLQNAIGCLSVKRRSLPLKKAEMMVRFIDRLKHEFRS